jgi:hypothetical protein
MPKKEKIGRTDDDLLPDIEKMKQQGKSNEEIRKELNIGQGRLHRLLEKLQSRTISPTGEIQIPPPTEQAIINETVNRASGEVVEKLSSKFAKDYVGSMKAAAILKELEMRHKLTVESWGFTWEDFVQQAIEFAFQKYNDYLKLRNFLLSMAMEEVK